MRNSAPDAMHRYPVLLRWVAKKVAFADIECLVGGSVREHSDVQIDRFGPIKSLGPLASREVSRVLRARHINPSATVSDAKDIASPRPGQSGARRMS